MRQPSCSRRTLLRRGSAAASTATLAGLAGCSGLGSVVDGSPDVPFYATWLPAPERVIADDVDPARRWYPIRARRFDELAAYRRERGESFESTALYRDGKAHPVVDVDPSEATTEVRAGGRGISVLETTLLGDEVVEAFRTPESGGPIREPFERVGEYEGYRLLAAPDGDWVVGVDGGAVVEAFAAVAPDPLDDKRAVVEAVIDARNGEGRYIDADETLGGVVRRLGTGLSVRAGPPVSTADGADEGDDDPVASGTAYTDAETDNATRVVAFPDAEGASDFAADPESDATRSWADTAVSRDGRFVTITGTNHPV